MSEPIEIKPDDYHKIFTAICTNLAREDSNTGQRVGWAISLSGGMFTAIAFIAARVNDFCGDGYGPSGIAAGIAGVAAMALFFSIKSLRGVESAHNQIKYLKDHYKELRGVFEQLSLPRPYGDDDPLLGGMQSSVVFPRVLIVFWAVVLMLAVLATGATLVGPAAGSACAAPAAKSAAQH